MAFAPRSVIASAVRWAAASSMSLQTTAPPRRPSSAAKAAPMPLPAPVTTADAPRLVFDLPSSLSNIAQPTSVTARASCKAWVMNRATYPMAAAASGINRGSAWKTCTWCGQIWSSHRPPAVWISAAS